MLRVAALISAAVCASELAPDVGRSVCAGPASALAPDVGRLAPPKSVFARRRDWAGSLATTGCTVAAVMAAAPSSARAATTAIDAEEWKKLLRAAADDATADASPAMRTSASGIQYVDLRVGNFTNGREIREEMMVILDYRIWKSAFGGDAGARLVESSDDRNRMPLLFTVGTGAINRAVGEMVRDMKQGGVRRFVIPPKFGPSSFVREELFVEVRLRNVKGQPVGLRSFCAVPPNGKVEASMLCEPGSAVKTI